MLDTLVWCLAAILATVLVAILVVAARVGRRRDPGYECRTVVVQTTDGRSLRGVVHGDHADRVALRGAVLLRGDGDTDVPLDGCVWIDRSAVAFLQVIGG